MIEGKLIDLVPFEDDFSIYMEDWMNEESWFRARFWSRREPSTEDDVKKFIEKMEKDEHGALIGFQSKNGDPIGGVIYDDFWRRVRKVSVNWFVGDMRYEATDEALDGLLMICRYMFETHNVHRVEAAALSFDEVRIEHLRRAGFVHEGTLRQHIRWSGDYVDLESFGLLESEWPGYEQRATELALEGNDLEPKPKPKKDDDSDNGDND